LTPDPDHETARPAGEATRETRFEMLVWKVMPVVQTLSLKYARSTAKASEDPPELMSCRPSPRRAQQVSSAHTSVNYVHPLRSGLFHSHRPFIYRPAQRDSEGVWSMNSVLLFSLSLSRGQQQSYPCAYGIRALREVQRIPHAVSCAVSTEGLPF
jgi:hypothetical protein